MPAGFEITSLLPYVCARALGIPRSVRPVCLSVCLSHGVAALGMQLPWAIGTLAACSLAICGLWIGWRTDVDPPRVELPSAGGGHICDLAAPYLQILYRNWVISKCCK